MTELLFDEADKAKTAVLWQTLVSGDLLKAKIVKLIKESHNILLANDLQKVFDEVIDLFVQEEIEINQNFKNFNVEVKNNEQEKG